MNKIRLAKTPRFRPSNPSLPVAVPLPGTHATKQPGWISGWACELKFELAPFTLGDEIALVHGGKS